jgi:hypothetical protein
MDAGVEATQERLPDVLSKSPAPGQGLAELEPGKRQAGRPFSWLLLFAHPGKREKVTRPPKEYESSRFKTTTTARAIPAFAGMTRSGDFENSPAKAG